MAALLNLPALTSIQEARVALPSDDRLWDATDAVMWDQAVQDVRAEHGSIEVLFLPTFQQVLQGSCDLSRVSAFGRAIISHTAYRLSHDAYLLQTALSPAEDGLNLEMYKGLLDG